MMFVFTASLIIMSSAMFLTAFGSQEQSAGDEVRSAGETGPTDGRVPDEVIFARIKCYVERYDWIVIASDLINQTPEGGSEAEQELYRMQGRFLARIIIQPTITTDDAIGYVMELDNLSKALDGTGDEEMLIEQVIVSNETQMVQVHLRIRDKVSKQDIQGLSQYGFYLFDKNAPGDGFSEANYNIIPKENGYILEYQTWLIRPGEEKVMAIGYFDRNIAARCDYQALPTYQ